MIDAFNQIGTTPTPPAPIATKRPGPPRRRRCRPLPHSQVIVNVLNASTVNGIAHTTAAALDRSGLHDQRDRQRHDTARGRRPSEILYGPSGHGAALTLGSTLTRSGSRYVPDSSLSGADGLAARRRLAARRSAVREPRARPGPSRPRRPCRPARPPRPRRPSRPTSTPTRSPSPGTRTPARSDRAPRRRPPRPPRRSRATKPRPGWTRQGAETYGAVHRAPRRAGSGAAGENLQPGGRSGRSIGTAGVTDRRCWRPSSP